MATTFFLRDIASPLGGAGVFSLSQRRGNAAITAVTTSTAGGTNIPVTLTAGGTALTWYSGPCDGPSVTVSGDITVNLRGLESANAVNAGLAILIENVDNAGAFRGTVLSRRVVGAELTTTQSARTLTVAPTSTVFSNGERFKVTISLINVGTMGAGTASFFYNGGAAAATGDSYITIAEDIVTGDIQDVSPFEIKGSNAYYG